MDVHKMVNSSMIGLSLAQNATEKFIDFVPTLSVTLITLVVGLLVISCVTRVVQQQAEKIHIHTGLADSLGDDDSSGSDEKSTPLKAPDRADPTLVRFFMNLTRYSLRLLLFVTCAGMLGVHISSFVSILAMCSLSIGLALQGSLKDVASGIMLIIQQTYVVGDFVSINKLEGKVEEVGLFNTVMITPDNRSVTVPNGDVATVTNFTTKGTKRIDVFFTLEREGDYMKAKAALLRVANGADFVLQQPAAPTPPMVLIHELSVYGVRLKIRAWSATANYRKLPYILREKGLLALQAEGIALAQTKYSSSVAE